MTDYQQALAAARAAYNRLLREDRTAEACQIAEDALCVLLAAIDAAQGQAVAGAVLERDGGVALVRHGSETEYCRKHSAVRLYAVPPTITGVLFQHGDSGRTTCVSEFEADDFARVNKRWLRVGAVYSAPPAAAASKTDTARFLTADIDWIDRMAERLAAEDWEPWLRLRRAMVSDAELEARHAPE